MDSKFLSVLVLLVLFSTVAFAQQIYKWKDNKGQWHFSDAPPPEVKAEKVKGLDIGPIPPIPPKIAEPPTPPESSKSKEKAFSEKEPADKVTSEYYQRAQRKFELIRQQIEALKKRLPEEIVYSRRRGFLRSKPSYTKREYERLTNELDKLFEKRDKLVREMERRGFEIGSIPYK